MPDERSASRYARLKDSRGRFPITGAELGASPTGAARIEFAFPDEPDPAPLPAFNLESLAGSLPAIPQVSQDLLLARLRENALATGPIFGEAAAESATEWLCEIRIAQAALRIQQSINGDLDIARLGDIVVASEVCDAGTGEVAFRSYCLSLVVGVGIEAALERLFPAMPWMKRFADDGGSCDYAFACCDASDDQHVLDIHLIAFPHEIRTGDYAVMTDYFARVGYDVSDALAADAAERGVELAAVDPAPAGELLVGESSAREAVIDAADAPHLQRLVHVLIALHTEGVHVDLFKSDGSADFLAFDTYLSSLWYDFAMRLGTVKMGYCLQCGKGFSTTGHRGMDKEYCSEACRTQAKNERRRAQKAQLRKLFMEGRAVAEVAAEVYPDMAPAVAQDNVRKELRRWPALKHAVEEDLLAGDGAFTKRCLEDDAIDRDFVVRKAKLAAKRRRG